MNLDKFDGSLEKYLEAITLTWTQESKISAALESVLALALTAFPEAEVYAQGSFATDTMARPLTSKQGGGSAGQYDIDIAIESEAWDEAVDALDDLANAVEDDNTFGTLTVDKTMNSCIRVEYPEDYTGVAFHIDLVPTKLENGKRTVPDRGAGDWKPSDAKQFAEWFNRKAEAQPGLRQIAVILKRLRDLNGHTDNLKSIMLLALVERNYYANGSIMGDLLSVLDGAVTLLASADQPPFVANPVNSGENLSDGIDDYRAVRSFFMSTRDNLISAISSDDATALKETFGTGFEYRVEGQTDASMLAAAALPVRPTRAYGVNDAASDCEG